MNRDDDSTASAASRGLPVADALALERACDRFEKAWRLGGRPDLPAAVADLPGSVHAAAARELIELEVYYRRKAGEVPALADYLGQVAGVDVDWLAEVVGRAPSAAGRTASAARGPTAGRWELPGESEDDPGDLYLRPLEPRSRRI